MSTAVDIAVAGFEVCLSLCVCVRLSRCEGEGGLKPMRG